MCPLPQKRGQETQAGRVLAICQAWYLAYYEDTQNAHHSALKSMIPFFLLTISSMWAFLVLGT